MAKTNKENRGPEFIKFIKPIVDVLKALDGSGSSSEVTDLVIEKMKIPEAELENVLRNGSSRVKNQIHWARMYLVSAGYIDASKRGIWSLTEEGMNLKIQNHKDAYSLFKSVQDKFQPPKPNNQAENDVEQDTSSFEESIQVVEDYRDELLKILKNLPPHGFERICQRLLRVAGFKKVVITGKSGDGGIDGEGILEINPLMSFKVLFQSKRYQGSVSASQVRDFRGAMTGRADKGIIITTGRFTQDAKKEALRDGAPPIELVDGDILINLFEENQLGLKPRTIYDIDYDFFNDFKNDK